MCRRTPTTASRDCCPNQVTNQQREERRCTQRRSLSSSHEESDVAPGNREWTSVLIAVQNLFRQIYAGDRHGCDSFAATDKPHLLIRCGFDADMGGGHAK